MGEEGKWEEGEEEEREIFHVLNMFAKVCQKIQNFIDPTRGFKFVGILIGPKKHALMLKNIPIFGFLLAILCGCTAHESTPENHPNIVIIYCDDLGYGDLGVFGNQQIRTPHLDQMAVDGMKLTSLYSVSPVCSPSRAGLLTGRYPVRMGIHGVFFPESWTGMPSEETTIAEKLSDWGYATGCIGKWHLGHHYPYLPLQQGFDEYFGIPYSNDMEAVVYLEGNELYEHTVDQSLTTKTYTEKALDFIDRHQDIPFFLYLPHSMPHVPIHASDQFTGKSERGLYGDVIEEIDWSVGQILEKLTTAGLEENTIVLFTSDNGPWLVFGPDSGSAGPLREGKQFTFEGGMRVPGIVQWKGKIQAGSESDELVTMMDWFPTIVSLTGHSLSTDREVDGNDISPLLLKGESTGDREFAYFSGGELQAYRYGDWKLKLPYKGNNWSRWRTEMLAHDTLLFNLKEDPGEQNNQLTDRPQKVIELVSRMETFINNLGELPPGLPVKQGADNSHYQRQDEWRGER